VSDRTAPGGIAWYPPGLSFPASMVGLARFLETEAPRLVAEAPRLDAPLLAATGDTGHVAEGQALLDGGDISGALGAFEKGADRHPHAAALAGVCALALGRLHRAVFHFETILRIIDGWGGGASYYHSLGALSQYLIAEEKSLHMEADAMVVLCDGSGIDVGCGSNKTCATAIGVDLTPGGESGVHGGQAAKISAADIVSPGDDLPMFADGALDYVVARHNYEHYQDPLAPLIEWERVLRPGGRLGIIVPDHRWVDTIRLDPTHYHAYTDESLARMVDLIAGLRVVWRGPVVNRWSVGVVAVREGGEGYDYDAALVGREVDRIERYAARLDEAGRGEEATQCRNEAARLARRGRL
jgi:SAM-dependent methyltransferase